MTDATKLLPCPFCGGTDISKYKTTGDERVGYTDTISLTCHPCGVILSRRSETDKNGWANEPGDKLEARVIAAWNRRAPVADSAMAKDIRREALMEAARICDRMVSVSAVSYETGTACAHAIRDLAASEPKKD